MHSLLRKPVSYKVCFLLFCHAVTFCTVGYVCLIISRNLAIAMSTLKETSTTKFSRQGSSSHQQLSVHVPMVMLPAYCFHLCTHAFSYVEINVYSYSYITCLPCQCFSESAPKYNLSRDISFQKFSGTMLPDLSSFVCLVQGCRKQYLIGQAK